MEDIPTNMPESRLNEVSTSMFADVELEGDKSARRSHVGVLIIINWATIHCYNKRQENVKASTFG